MELKEQPRSKELQKKPTQKDTRKDQKDPYAYQNNKRKIIKCQPQIDIKSDRGQPKTKSSAKQIFLSPNKTEGVDSILSTDVMSPQSHSQSFFQNLEKLGNEELKKVIENYKNDKDSMYLICKNLLTRNNSGDTDRIKLLQNFANQSKQEFKDKNKDKRIRSRNEISHP